jgi:hypothetical protein
MATIFTFLTLQCIATKFFIYGCFLNFFLKLAIGKKMLAAELSCGRGGRGRGTHFVLKYGSKLVELVPTD